MARAHREITGFHHRIDARRGTTDGLVLTYEYRIYDKIRMIPHKLVIESLMVLFQL